MNLAMSALDDPAASVRTRAAQTLGIYDHDSAARVGAFQDQVASFLVDGNDLTVALNTALNNSGGTSVFSFPPLVLTSEYNIYTIALPASTFADLSDGSATFSLDLQNGLAFPLGVETDRAFNGAGLDFSTLNITTQDAINPIPEPTSLTLLGIGAVGLFGYGWRRKRKTELAA